MSSLRDEFLGEAVREPFLVDASVEVTKGKDGKHGWSNLAVFLAYVRAWTRRRMRCLKHRRFACPFFHAAASQPFSEFINEGVYRGLLTMRMTMDGQPLLTLPSTDRPHSPFQVA